MPLPALKKSLALGAAVAAFYVAPALAQEFTPYAQMPAGVYSVDPKHASLVWKVSHVGLSNYTARFTKFDAKINFDPADVTKSTVTATIDPTSIETDFEPNEKVDFNKELSQSDQWLNAGAHPAITFTSTKVEKTGDTTGKLHGNLTLLGVTKPVVLDVTYNGAYAEQPFSKQPTLGFSAKGKIKRSDWGFSTYVPAIGDEVEFAIEAEFAKQ